MDWWLSLWSRSRRLNSAWQREIPRRQPSQTCPNRSAAPSFMTVWTGTIGTCSISQSLHLETSRRAPRQEPQTVAPRSSIGSRPSKTTRPNSPAAMKRWRPTTSVGYGWNWASTSCDDDENAVHPRRICIGLEINSYLPPNSDFYALFGRPSSLAVARALNLRFFALAADLVIVLARARQALCPALMLGASNNLLSRSAVGSSCSRYSGC